MENVMERQIQSVAIPMNYPQPRHNVPLADPTAVDPPQQQAPIFTGCWPAAVGVSDFTCPPSRHGSRANTTEQLE